MNDLTRQLASICREHLLTEKIVVAPSLAIGHQIADAVAQSGTSWVNLRIETVRTLSDAVAGFTLASEGWTVLSRAQALAIIERVCDDVLDSSSYFAALANRPGLHRAIQKSIEDLGHAGLEPDDLRGESFEDARKAHDLARVVAGYRDALHERKFIDRLGVLQRATAMLESGATQRTDAIWIVIDDVELTAAEQRLLKSAAGSWLTIGCTSAKKAKLAFRRAAGEENEIRGALRAILERGATFDDAELVYSTRDPYLPLLYELAAELEVPCTFAEGIASHFTRPGQATLAFLRWIGNGWHARDLRTFAGPHARIFRLAKIGWGRERHLPRIDAFLTERREAAQREDDELRRAMIERTIAKAEEARAFAADLLRVSECASSGDTLDVSAAAQAAADFVTTFAAPHNEIDAMARSALARLFHELAALPGGIVPRAEAARRLTEAVRALHVSASNPRPGFLHVAPVHSAGWSARRRMFVAGLDDQHHPGSGLQDPVILDSERNAIGLPIVGDRPERVADQFRRLLARASARDITLSYAALGVRDRRERFPSAQFLDLYRATTGRREARIEELQRDTPSDGFVPSTSLAMSEWWMQRRFLDHDRALRSMVFHAYPWLADGARAEEMRDSEAITEWDGRVSAPNIELDPRLNGRTYSASQFESMASCPYRYFLERLLKIAPLDEIDYEPDRWLEANEFGTLLHSVLQQTMEELCGAGEKPSPAFLPRMLDIAAARLDEWRALIPPPGESAFERRRSELADACRIFLRSEEEACRDATPSHFELPYGPFCLPLGGGRGVLLRGRIDRVDHDGTRGEWHVWDYKSSSTYSFDQGGVLQRGTKIQHAIYARAIEELLQGRVTKSGYFFPTAKGNGARLTRACSDAELKEALNLLFDTIASGYFPHSGEDACTFCEFKSVCGGAATAARRAATKHAANARDAAVAAWLRLQEVR